MPTVNGTTSTPSTTSTTATTAAASPNGLKNARFANDPTFENIAAGKATMGVGAKGDAVKRLQTALLDMGFNMRPWTSGGKQVGGVDGAFGNQSKTGLINFQKHAANFFPDVKATGTLDKATLKALDALAPPPGAKAWAPGLTPKAPVPYWNGDKAHPLRVVVVKNEHRTYLYDKNGKVTGIFSNAVGAQASPTDTGLKKVTGKLGKADAEATGRRLWNDARAFGDRILDLSWADGRSSGEELHGTYAYDKMGTDASHGCMRHYNEDIVLLFNTLAVGDRIAVVDSLNDPRLRK